MTKFSYYSCLGLYFRFVCLELYERFIPFSFFVNDEKQKNQLYCLCLKMTADFGNLVAKNEEKRKTKDEMNPALVI